MAANDVWLGNHSWPSNRTCGDFARDVFRLSGAKTDKQKALAFYDWMTRCMMGGPNLPMPNNAGDYARSYEPLLQLTSWGHGECTYWGWIATECLNAAGVKARRVVAQGNGHCFHEVFYRGDDGREQWHAFDPFLGYYFLNEHGEVASCAEIGANPRLVQDPLPGHPEPLCHDPDGGLAYRHRMEDQLFIDQPMRNDVNAWRLRKGMEVTCNFMPAPAAMALFPRRREGEVWGASPAGSHCGISVLSREGCIAQPKHLPYWKNYMWPAAERSSASGVIGTSGLPVRWHGAGALRWRPLKYGAAAAAEVHNAVFEDGVLRPTGRSHFAEVWYNLRLPFLASQISIGYDVVGDGGDYFGLTLGSDGGRRVWPTMKLPTHAPHFGRVSNGQAEWLAGESSVQGLRDIWLRLDFFSQSASPKLAIRGLRIAVAFQHNMYIQPRILPGQNPLWLEAGELDAGDRVHAEWIYQLRGEENRARLELDKPGRAETTINLDAADPSEVWTTGIRLACV